VLVDFNQGDDMYYVYAIGLKKHLKEPYSNCYIGVTNDLERRWKAHTKSKYTVGNFIHENALTFEDNFVIVYNGDDKECYEMEEKYRPYPLMGLNEAVGGSGGYTSYSKERSEKISKAMTGKSKTKEHMKKIIENRKSYNDSENPNAKIWYLINPQGKEYKVSGQFIKFCEENNLLHSCLMRYRGNEVPAINQNGYGGYRAKSEKSKFLRENTTGWILV
jgi:hypothetical protein|tara:strand:- start:23 stop:679 length:657 start_codon:yes stop_codon:yes gene_type:complete